MAFKYIITMDTEYLFSTTLADKAAVGAAVYSKVYDCDVISTRFVDDEPSRTVIYHADGSKTLAM